jgi:hypothetical protein
MIEESLTSDLGIREQNRHRTDLARCLLSSRYLGVKLELSQTSRTDAFDPDPT